MRAARVTFTSVSFAVSSPTSACARTASTTAAAGTVPVMPRSGARKIGSSAIMPAFSTRSPMRTRAPVTVASALRTGRGGVDCAIAAALKEIEAARVSAKRIMVVPQRIRLEVACSIWSAAVITFEFIS